MDELLKKLIDLNFDLPKLLEQEGFTLSEFYDICINNPELMEMFYNGTAVVAKFQVDLNILNGALSGTKDAFNCTKLLIDKVLKITAEKATEELMIEMPTEDGEFIKVKL